MHIHKHTQHTKKFKHTHDIHTNNQSRTSVHIQTFKHIHTLMRNETHHMSHLFKNESPYIPTLMSNCVESKL